MTKLFYKLGRKFGASLIKGKWYYKSVFGSEEDAIQAEQLMGRELARKVIQESKLNKNPEQRKFIHDIKVALCKRITDQNRKFQIGILESTDVNAFALPGGYIFVTDSLVNLAKQNQDELAFVLSHEILHIMLKHPFNRIVADFSSQVVSGLVAKGGALSALAKKMLSDLLQKSYSRDKEFEADRLAVRLMYSAGFNPLASKVLLGRLKKLSPENLPIYNYFLTHPSIDERIKRIDDLIVERKMKI